MLNTSSIPSIYFPNQVRQDNSTVYDIVFA